MAVRQYIGARYVTKIYQNSQDANSAEWEAGVTYEPLTMVIYNNNSYISRSEVPASAGNPTAAPTYWAQTGFYSGQILDLQNRVEDLEEKKRTPSGKHIVIIADSYGDGSGEFPDLISDSGMFKQVDIIAGGGRGFTGKEGAGSGTTGPSLEWLTYFKNYVNGHTAAELADVDEVYICGGFNDHYSTEGVIWTHMQEFFEWAHEHMPCNYYLIETGWCSDQENITTPNGTFTSKSIRSAIANKVIPTYARAGELGCSYLGHVVAAVHDYGKCWNTTDYYHPSEFGESQLYRAILNLMLGGSNSWNRNGAQHVTYNNASKIIQSVRVTEDFIYCLGYTSRFFATPTADTTAHNPFTVDQITRGPAGDSRYFAARDGNNRNYIPCQIQTNSGGGDLYTTVMYYDDDGTMKIIAPIDLTTADTISVQPLATTIALLDC